MIIRKGINWVYNDTIKDVDVDKPELHQLLLDCEKTIDDYYTCADNLTIGEIKFINSILDRLSNYLDYLEGNMDDY